MASWHEEATQDERDEVGDRAFHLAYEDGTIHRMRAAAARALLRLQGEDRAAVQDSPWDREPAEERDALLHVGRGTEGDW